MFVFTELLFSKLIIKVCAELQNFTVVLAFRLAVKIHHNSPLLFSKDAFCLLLDNVELAICQHVRSNIQNRVGFSS